jgi:hypothetical protein
MQSMASFHRRLASIERTASPRYPYAGGMDVDARSLGVGESGGDLQHDDGWAAGWDGDGEAGPGGAGALRVSRRALRRRRQIFFTLLGAVLSSMAAAILSGAVAAWAVHGATLLLFISYIGLLVHHHQRAAEQVAKVRYLPPVRAARPAVVVLRSGTAR